MLILGIDPSLTGTGLVLIDTARKKPLIAEKIVTKKTDAPIYGMSRVSMIVDKIMDIVKKYNPDHIGIEGYAYHARGSVFDLAELGGVIKYVLLINGRDYIVATPTEVKKFITGKGNSNKNIMLLHVYKKFGIEFDDDNKADAYSIAKYIEFTVNNNEQENT